MYMLSTDWTSGVWWLRWERKQIMHLDYSVPAVAVRYLHKWDKCVWEGERHVWEGGGWTCLMYATPRRLLQVGFITHQDFSQTWRWTRVNFHARILLGLLHFPDILYCTHNLNFCVCISITLSTCWYAFTFRRESTPVVRDVKSLFHKFFIFK